VGKKDQQVLLPWLPSLEESGRRDEFGVAHGLDAVGAV